MKPLIESEIAVLAIALGVLGVVAIVAAYVEHRKWLRDSVRPNASPWDDPRDKLAEFRRWQAQRMVRR